MAFVGDLEAFAPGGSTGRVEVTATLFHTRGMKINTALLLIASFALLRGCAVVPSPPVKQLPAPAPKPQTMPPKPTPAPAPAAQMIKPVTAGWRDAPQTPGAWAYAAEPGGSAARFGLPGAAPLLVLRCDRARPAVVIQRESLGSGTLPAPLPVSVTTSSGARRLSAAPASGSPKAQNEPILFEVSLDAKDPLLDAMAFSRGRFLFEMGSAPALSLPAWAELGRVIEDCR